VWSYRWLSRKSEAVKTLDFFLSHPHPEAVHLRFFRSSIVMRLPMIPPVISALLACVTTLFRSGAAVRMENLALRHQVAVYKQKIPRPRLRPSDRLFWAWLSRLWSGWQAALAFVQPRTVIAW